MSPTRRFPRTKGAVSSALLLMLLAAGCSSTAPEHDYLQRSPIRVAVIPSENSTPEPSAPITFNKVCEEQLRRHGFEVVEADRVVTYASASGLGMRDLPGLKPSRLAADLKVDFLFYSKIEDWATKYHVVNGSSEVKGSSWLYEGPTDALVWQADWHEVRQSGNGGGGLLGVLVDAAMTAAMNSAFDVCAQLGAQAAGNTIQTLPNPGFEPVAKGARHDP